MIPELVRRLTGAEFLENVTLRAAIAVITGFVLALWWGKPAIAWLRRHKWGEDVSKAPSGELAAANLAAGKKGTPTLGGAFLVAALLASVLLWARIDRLHVVFAILLTAGFAAVGFVDDFRKLTVRGSSGLSPKAKMLGLSLVALLLLAGLAYFARTTGRPNLLALHPPVFSQWSLQLGRMGLIGIVLFLAFEWLVLCGTANAVNVTDGLDGLAAGCMIVSGSCLAIFCYVSGRADWTEYLDLPYVRDASEMAVVGGALVGACMGFLWYNAYPAKVFMGDSGSLPLGGLLAWMALVSKQELVLPLVGLVFFAELASSALQTNWYRITGGRRIFTMAPVHHGLQLKGGIFRPGAAPWHEVTIVVRAWIVAAGCGMGSLALLKVR